MLPPPPPPAIATCERCGHVAYLSCRTLIVGIHPRQRRYTVAWTCPACHSIEVLWVNLREANRLTGAGALSHEYPDDVELRDPARAWRRPLDADADAILTEIHQLPTLTN